MKVRKNKETTKAARIFTDREEPRAAFWNQYYATKADQHQEDCSVRVLNYYGIGGIGKSSLLKKIISEMEDQLSNPRYVYIDLNMYQESRTVLERIKNKLVDNYKFNFPLFELGSYAYAKKIGENADPVEVKQLTEKSPLLSMMLSAAGEIPVVGIAAKVLSFADQGIAYIRTHIKNHNRELKQIEIMEAEDLYKYLPYLFSQDMAHNLESNNTDEPLVIFFDTYEKLVNELSSVGEPLKNDEWIRSESGLVQNIPNVLWVIAGREKLKWTLFDTEWSDALETHILGNLSFSDSDHFLLNAGITDYKLREQLYDLTDGTPVYLDLCVDRFLRILDNGEIPNISLFGKNTFDLIERFVRYMDATQKDLVFLLACLNKWDDNLIAEIAPQALPNFSFSAYERTKDYSFVISAEDGAYNIHQTVGSVLLAECPSLIRKSIGHFLLEKYAKVLEKSSVFSVDYITALSYVVQAGVLLCTDRIDLRKFYEEEVERKLFAVAEAGRAEQIKSAFETMFDSADNNPTDSFYTLMLNEKTKLYIALNQHQFAYTHAENAFNLIRDMFGDNHYDTIIAMFNLADAFLFLDKFQDAKKLYLEALEKAKLILGENHPNTITIIYHLSVAYGMLEEFEKTVDSLLVVVEKRSNLLGIDHKDTISAIEDLETIIKNCDASLLSAKTYLNVYKKYCLVFGEDHTYAISALEHYAYIKYKSNDLNEAADLYEKLLQKRKIKLGEDHNDTIATMNNLALVSKELGNYDKAIWLYAMVYEKRKAILGENDPNTMSSFKNLAFAYAKAGKSEEFSKIYRNGEKGVIACSTNELFRYQKTLCTEQTIYERYLSTLGEDHPYTLSAQTSLAETFENSGKYDEALNLHQSVLAKRKKVLGEGHEDTIKTMYAVALLFCKLNNYENSLSMYQEVYEISKSDFGMNHPKTLLAMQKLAYVYNKMGLFKEELSLRRTLFENSKAVFGVNHSKTITAMNSLSVTLNSLGQNEESLELELAFFDARKAILGENDLEIINEMERIGTLFGGLRNYQKALQLFKTVYEKRTVLLGKEHEDTLRSIRNVACIFSEMGEYEEALQHFQIAFELTKKMYGENSIKMLLIMNHLVCLFRKIDAYKKAIELYPALCELNKKYYGDDSTQALCSAQDFAFALYMTEKYEDAFELQQTVFEKLNKKMGKNHTDTIKAKKLLFSIIEKFGDISKVNALKEKFTNLTET